MDTQQARFIFDTVSAFLLLGTALTGAYLPRYLAFKNGYTPGEPKSAAFHLGNMLSAGVMLSAGFCHLLADSLRSLAFVGRFPMATFLAAVGYIVTLLADQVVHLVQDAHSTVGEEEMDVEEQVAACSSEDAGALAAAAAAGDPMVTELAAASAIVREVSAASLVQKKKRAGGDSYSSIPEVPPSGVESAIVIAEQEEDGKVEAAALLPKPRAGRAGSRPVAECSSVKVFLAHRPLSFATAVLLACALCVHSILEGIAQGAQQTMQETEDIMIAIIAHKGLAAYALGASVIESRATPAKYWTVIGLFSAATPIGIFIGYAMSAASGLWGAVMSAMASGTFLYVAMMEVIPKELADPRFRVAKMGMFLLGFCLMSMLAIWA